MRLITLNLFSFFIFVTRIHTLTRSEMETKTLPSTFSETFKQNRSFSSDSDSTYPPSSTNASPDVLLKDDDADLTEDCKDSLDLFLSSPVIALERSFSELSYDLQEENESNDDECWDQLLNHLESNEFNDANSAPIKVENQDLKSFLLKKPEKPKTGKNFTEAERRERNRIAAANSRIKRKFRLKDLEEEVKDLKKIIERKDATIAGLEKEVNALNQLLQQEFVEASNKKRKRIKRSKHPMLSNSAKLGLLCCVSVCLAMSPWEEDTDNSYAFAMGGIQRTNAQSLAYIFGFILIIACTISLGRSGDTIVPLQQPKAYGKKMGAAANGYILPFYWISAAVTRDIGLRNGTRTVSHVPKPGLL